MTFDQTFLRLLNHDLAHPLWDAPMVLLTTAGLVALPALILPLWRRRRSTALALALSQGAGLCCCLVLQQLVGRVRPEHARVLLGQPDCFSFPSGHATLVSAAAVVLVLARPVLPLRWAAVPLALGVGVSRVAVGHHWPTDVVAGLLLGLGIGLGCHGLLDRGARGLARWRWLIGPWVAVVAVVILAAWQGLLVDLVLPFGDKQLHFAMLGALSFWTALWWEHPARPGGPLRAWGWLPWSLLLPAGLALIEEVAQRASPHRTADPADLACDLAGMGCFWVLGRVALRLERRGLVAAPPIA